MSEVDSPLFTIPEVAKFLNVSERTVQRLIKRGDLSATKVGRQMRISRYALDQLLREGNTASPSVSQPDYTTLF
jgi:putative molybdopterin biosynthesis protein